MNRLTGKVSNLIVAFFMGAIIISFALTGFSGFNNTANSVGKVDGNPITIREYQNAYNQQIQNYTRMFGKDLTAQQIRQFRIRENVLNQLITRKVMTNYALNNGLESAEDELKKSIKELPYFKTNDKFDVNKYKQLLRANNLTPSKFEETFLEDLAIQKVNEIMDSTTISKAYARDVIKFKNMGPMVLAVRFEKEKNTSKIPVSKEEIKTFIENPENEAILKSVYNGMKSEFVKDDEVKASHILLRVEADKSNDKEVLAKAKALRKKLTRSNFATYAKKETEDPSGKANGGDLGYFPQGRMVPEFDKAVFSMKNGTISQPVKTNYGYHIIYRQGFKKGFNKKLEEVKDIVAKAHLQKTKREELKKVNDKLKDELTAALVAKNTKRIEKMAKEYGFTFVKDKNLNFFDANVDSIKFDFETIKPLMSAENIGKVYIQDDVVDTKLILAYEAASEDIEALKADKFEAQYNAMVREFQGTMQNTVIKQLRDKSDIVTYSNML